MRSAHSIAGARPIMLRLRAVALGALGALTLAAAAPSAAAAQDSTTARRGFCFRGRPLPQCESFLLVEAAYYRRIAGSRFKVIDTNEITRETTDYNDRDSHFSWELGYMQNLDRRNAVGGTLLVGTGDAGARFGAKGRYRRWVGGDGTGRLDFGVGALRGGMRQRVPNPTPGEPGPDYNVITIPAYGVTADVTYDIGDLFGVSSRVELLRDRNGRSGTAVFGGVRLGSYSAVVASAAAGAALVWLIYALSQNDL